LRKHFYGLTGIRIASVIGFQILDALVRLELSKRLQLSLTHIDLEKGKISSIGDGRFFDIHEIFQAPILFSVSEIEFDLKSQAVKLDDLIVSHLQVGAK